MTFVTDDELLARQAALQAEAAARITRSSPPSSITASEPRSATWIAIGRSSDRVRIAMIAASNAPAVIAAITGSGEPTKSGPPWARPNSTACATTAGHTPLTRAIQVRKAPRYAISSMTQFETANSSAGTIAPG
jgi:hypothetical protein